MPLTMPLDICIESYGAAVHVIDTLLSSGFYLRPSGHRGPVLTADHVSLDRAIEVATAGLAFSDARALWLVDVCGCSYDEAAIEARVSRDEIAARVALGRSEIRAAIAADFANATT